MSNDKAKTPLHYYEIAITELAQMRQEFQLELEEIKKLKLSYQTVETNLENAHSEIQFLKRELQQTRNQTTELETELTNAHCAIKHFADGVKETQANIQNIRIESGVFSGNTRKTEGWNNNLYGKEGKERIFKETVYFKKPFVKIPQVVVGISYADVKQGANYRLRVLADNITVESFELLIQTWRDTQVWGADVNWLAYGLN